MQKSGGQVLLTFQLSREQSMRLVFVITIAALLSVQDALAQSSARGLSLPEVLSVALQRAPGSEDFGRTPQYQASGWLAALPSVSLSYLDSDTRNGVDETEASLRLPIKGGKRRRADSALQQLALELRSVAGQQRALYFSGLIREAVWSHRIAEVRGQFAVRKQQLLRELEARYRSLLAANATSEYSLLLIQKELVNARISESEFQRELRQWQQQYRRITGLGSMPSAIEEPAVPQSDGMALQQHPGMRQLELAWRQEQQLLLANSSRARSWDLALTAKNLDSPVFEENQYGLSVEIPLSFLELESQSNNSAWQDLSQRHAMARDELAEQLGARWDGLVNDRLSLRAKQELLSASNVLSERIVAQIAHLQASNEVTKDVALRRTMEALDTEMQLAVNRLKIHQNNAMLRQAAGISL
jgi:hypothetical protein